ncbi:acyltransferase family protein [Microbacterium xylanilyticum]
MAYRNDIDGLRAVAVVLVVVYHVWFDRVSGGVDVFLIVSAFFLTLSFARRVRDGEALRIPAFLLARFRRLMPAAAVTIAAVLGAAWLLMPATAWPQLWREGWASVGYVQNWVLAATGVDYYARDQALPSPLQHFWSLSVQGQVFVLWPFIFLLGAVLARRLKRSPTVILAILFGMVFAGSLTFSIIETQEIQTLAYFDTRTRLWEFAAGSLVALALPSIRLPKAVRAVLGWIGLIAILICGIVIDVRGGFPGYLALWPVLATAFVIIGGADDGGWGPSRLLGARPIRAMGKDAYALYLVHWPILILTLTVLGRTRADILTGAAVVAASFVMARILRVCVEKPLMPRAGAPRAWQRNAGVLLACVVLVAAVLVPWQTITRIQADEAAAAARDTSDVAKTAAPPGTGPLVPQPIDLDDEWVSLEEACSGRLAPQDESLQEGCAQTPGAADAATLVVAVGDSHTEQMLGALMPVAEQKGWGLVSLLHGGCSLADHPPGTELADKCADWRRAAIDQVVALKPAAVYTVMTAAVADDPGEQLIEGASDLVDEFQAAGIAVIAVRDNPRSQSDLYQCALDRLDCDRAVGSALAASNPVDGLGDRVIPVDFTPWICPQGRCITRSGNLALYLDDNHLTHAFTTRLAGPLRAQLTRLS